MIHILTSMTDTLDVTSADNPDVIPPVVEPTGADPRPIHVRRVSFADSLAELPKYFAGDSDVFMSHLLANLSAVFPDGEEFFVRSVRRFRKEVTDPQLRRDIGAFIGQEAIHGREHRDLNRRLDEMGYRTRKIEKLTDKGLRGVEKPGEELANLALTAALEHFTATLAEVLLAEPDARQVVGAECVLDVLLWHALEEAEHKAVAFDVYKLAGGTEKMRRKVMNIITYSFISTTLFRTFKAVLMDREAWRDGQVWKSMKRVRHNPFVRLSVWRKLRDYNRADFHPNDHDTDALLDEWRERLFGADGTMNHRLVSAAA